MKETAEMLKAQAYDLIEKRGELLMEAKVIEVRLNEIKEQIDALKEADGKSE